MMKMGRPAKEVVKDKIIGVRFEQKDYERLLEYAIQNNLTITQVIRQGVELLYAKTPQK